MPVVRSYPKELERDEWRPMGSLKVRPIHPEDAEALKNALADLSLEDSRLRFFSPIRTVEPERLARLTRIDYDREMALVVVPPDEKRIFGVARLVAGRDNVSAEFGIAVASDLHRRGIGRLLLARLIEYARAQGLRELCGHVLRENIAMLALAATLGFATTPGESPEIMLVTLRLNASA